MELKDIPGIQRELALVEEYLHIYANYNEESGALKEILETVIKNKGKMLRPAMMLLSARFGPDYGMQENRLGKAGAMLEMVHLASLIHDDIVDDSPLRRGQQSIQYRFGKDMAVYAGDYLLSRVMYNLFSEGMKESGIILGNTVMKMCRGELGQFVNRYNLRVTVESYLQNIHDKTASMFVAACSIGALECGCSDRLKDDLALIGSHLGYIFQIRDDLLDFVSDEAKEGKPVHSDLRDGIYTLPILFALNCSTVGETLQIKLSNMKMREITNGELNEVESIVEQAGGIEFARQTIVKHKEVINKILKTMDENEGKKALFALTDWLSSV